MRVGALQLRASSLLVFHSVLKGAVGEAFLAALAATQKYQVVAKRPLRRGGRVMDREIRG